MCVSNRPTDPKILSSTLTFFMPKKILSFLLQLINYLTCSTMFFLSLVCIPHSLFLLLKSKTNTEMETETETTDPNFEDHAIGNTHIFFLA
jgi:hypothetical protein